MKKILCALLAFFVLTGCDEKTTPGPIDGNYTFATWTCGATDVMALLLSGTVTTVKLNISNTTGNTEVTYTTATDPCIRTQPLTITYGEQSTADLIESAPSCSATCTNQCDGYIEASSTYTYALEGNTLTTTRTLTQDDIDNNSVLGAAGCNEGDVETRTMTK